MKKIWTKLQIWQKIIIIFIGISSLGLVPMLENNNNYQNSDLYEVIRVVDGDTIKINYNGKEESVRLIGIDTPENVHPDQDKNTNLGKCASEYTKNKLEGKYITLEFDVQEKDQYQRLLAYVYLDGKMFNKTLLEEGYAQISTYPPNVKYVDEFTELQKQAREDNKGLWNENNCIDQTTTNIINTNSQVVENATTSKITTIKKDTTKKTTTVKKTTKKVTTKKTTTVKTTTKKITTKNVEEVLPLKALCNDGTYSYATSASKTNYQGQCSNHGGIKEKLGRVK